MYIVGISTTVIAIVILWLLQPLEVFVYKKSNWKTLVITIRSGRNSVKVLDLIFSQNEITIKDFKIEVLDDNVSEVNISTNNLAQF